LWQFEQVAWVGPIASAPRAWALWQLLQSRQ
jgi:hypothetical protein